MLGWLRRQRKLSDRKARLYARACARRAWPLIREGRLAKVVDIAEKYADGVAGASEFASVLPSIARRSDHWAVTLSLLGFPLDPQTVAANCTVALGPTESSYQAALLRDIVANPFAPPPHLDPAWLKWQDATVLRMATAIYEESAFGRMPLLGDALMDAGCDEEAVLAHCREQGAVHVRGCWVLDLLLGKE
jgi:hypothetical protein